MLTVPHTYVATRTPLCDEVTWQALYPQLYACARRFIYLFRVSCWYGQEEDMVDDVVQEAIQRIFERVQKIERGEATPIYSLEGIIMVTAQNYIRDLQRHDRRVYRLAYDLTDEMSSYISNQNGVIETTIDEQVSDEWFFQPIARIIASFPSKQRRALLIDLANLMYFDTKPTPLQAAFLDLGIDLKAYQIPLSNNPIERTRHATLLSYAYKRLTQLALIKRWNLQ